MLFSIKFIGRIVYVATRILFLRKRVAKRSKQKQNEIKQLWKGQFDPATFYKITIDQLRSLSFSPSTYAANNFDEAVFQYAHQ